MTMNFFGEVYSKDSFDKLRIGSRVGLAHGTYDLFHYGHLRHLKAASVLCEILIVSITADRWIKKGPGRPIFDENQRAETLASLSFVDAVVIVDAPSAIEVLQWLRPEIYIKGSEYQDTESDPTGAITAEIDVAEKNGGSVMYTDEPVFSSSRLINRELSAHGEEARAKQMSLAQMGLDKEIKWALDAISQYHVCIVGESILDSYISCDALGKVNKDPLLAFVPGDKVFHSGGVISIALHLASLVKEVTLVTQDSLKTVDSINTRKFPTNINIISYDFVFDNARMEKCRYVDAHTSTKIFETYSQKELSYTDGYDDSVICKYMEENETHFDAILVADYGHGMLGNVFAGHSSKYQEKLAVNVQSNAGNRGFNFVSKYPCARFISLAEHELRLEMRDNITSAEELLASLSKRFGSWPFICLTAGKNGIHVLNAGDASTVHCPAFASRVVDRVGAGDAVFSVSSLLAIAGASAECIAFMGNIAGGMAVAVPGNERPLDKSTLAKAAVSLLKV